MLSVEEEKGRERGRERGSVPTWTSDALIRDTLLVRTYVHARKIPRDCHLRFYLFTVCTMINLYIFFYFYLYCSSFIVH